jgi:acyl-coenzyme A thioesterase PaaI-like protein
MTTGSHGARLAHHDLCWGCGAVNPFGLQLELAPAGEGLAGRFFVKQDLQGPDGRSHDGVLAAALQEALGFAAGGPVSRLTVELRDRASLGTFVGVEAERAGGEARAVARADDGRLLATARAALPE